MDVEEIFTYYAQHVYRYLLSLSKDHHLTEDLLQEVFYRAHIHIQELTPDKIKPWLFRVAHNLLIDHLRKNNRVSYLDDEDIVTEKDGTNIEEEIIKQEKMAGLINKINQLSPNQKYAVILCDLNDLSYEECADVMGITISAFKSILYRARKNIRKDNHNEVKNDE